MSQTQEVTVSRPQQAALTQEAQTDIDGLRAIQYAAKLMQKSGCFADIKGVDEETAIAKAVVKIAIGRDYGFSTAESMQHIELIQGRPSIAAHARAAKMKAAGYSWKFLKFDSAACNIEVYGKNGERMGDSTFSLEDAKRMGLAEKDNWTKNPRNMLYCRAISNAQRWYAPEVLSAALISTEELVDMSPMPSDRDGASGSPEVAEDVFKAKMAAIKAADTSPQVTEVDPAENVSQDEQAKAVSVKHLGAKNGVAIYDGFPAAENTMHGQKIYVQNESTKNQPRLFAFDSEMETPNGGKGEFLPLEEPAEEKPAGTGPRAIRK